MERGEVMAQKKKATKKAAKKTSNHQDIRAKVEALRDTINSKPKLEGKVYLGRDAEPLERISSGVLAFDYVTGGGFPRRRYTELFGEESCFKTTLALHGVASAQRSGGVAAWVVGEEFDDDWAAEQGVDVDNLVKIEAVTGDVMLEMAATFLESGLVDLMVLDSVQAIGTIRESEDAVTQESYGGGGSAQLWGRMYRRTRGIFNSRKSNAAIIGISQARSAIGAFSPTGKPDPRPTQIYAIRHWKSISVYFKKGEPVYVDAKNDKKRLLSQEFKLVTKKNKTAPPGRASAFTYRFDGGKLDVVDEAFRFGLVYGLIEAKGAYYEGYDLREKGREAFLNALRADPDLVQEIRTDVVSEIKRSDA